MLSIQSGSDSLYTHSKLNLIHPAISDNTWSSDTKSLKLSLQSLLNSMIHNSYMRFTTKCSKWRNCLEKNFTKSICFALKMEEMVWNHTFLSVNLSSNLCYYKHLWYFCISTQYTYHDRWPSLQWISFK